MHGAEAVIHLATSIPPPERMDDPTAWGPNDRLRDEAVGLLVDAVLASGTDATIAPTVAFVYPPGPADETTALGDIPDRLRSALAAEQPSSASRPPGVAASRCASARSMGR